MFTIRYWLDCSHLMAQLGMTSSMASLLTRWSLGWECCSEIGEGWLGISLSFGFFTAWWYPSSRTSYVMATFSQSECSKKPRQILQSCFWQSPHSHVASFPSPSTDCSRFQISRQGDDTRIWLLGDPWEAQRFGTCLWSRARSWSRGIESHVGLPAWGPLLPLPVSLPLSLSLYHK